MCNSERARGPLTFILHYRRDISADYMHLAIISSPSGVLRVAAEMPVICARVDACASARHSKIYPVVTKITKYAGITGGEGKEEGTEVLKARGDNSGELIKRQQQREIERERNTLYINNRICTRVRRKRKRKGKRRRALFVLPPRPLREGEKNCESTRSDE